MSVDVGPYFHFTGGWVVRCYVHREAGKQAPHRIYWMRACCSLTSWA